MSNKNRFIFTILGLFTLSLAACEDYTSAEGVLHTAGQALVENDPSLFNKTLTGSALHEYGNLDGMSRLQRLLQGNTPELTDLKLIATHFLNAFSDEKHTYTGLITVQGKPVIDVRVQCLINYPIGTSPLNGESMPRIGSPTIYQVKTVCKIENIAPR